MSYQVTQADAAIAREVAAAQSTAPKAELRTGSSFEGGRWNALTNEVTPHQQTSKQLVGPDLTQAVNTDILATARRSTGSAVVGEYRETDVVRYAGMDIRIREAVSLGLLERVPGGGYRQVSAEAAQGPAKEEVKIDTGYEEGAEALDEADEQTFSALVSSVDAGVQYSALNDITETGELSKSTLTRLATQLGTVPEQANEMVSQVVAAFQRQADAAVSAAGVADPNEVWTWAKAARPKELAAAMHAQAAGRSTSAYTKLANEFLATKATSNVKAFTQSDRGQALAARKGHNGQVVVTVPGYGEMLYSVAIRLGLIK